MKKKHEHLRVLSVKLNDGRTAAACAVWQVLNREQLYYDLTGRLPLKTLLRSHERILVEDDHASVACCWLFPETDLAECQRLGFVDADCSYQEYLDRIDNLRRQCEGQAARLYVIESPLTFILDELRERGLKRAQLAELLQYLYLEIE